MFQFPELAPFRVTVYLLPLGFPIRKFPDHRLLASSPRLIAGSYVLHRLLTPRHPPDALCSLNTNLRMFIHLLHFYLNF